MRSAPSVESGEQPRAQLSGRRAVQGQGGMNTRSHEGFGQQMRADGNPQLSRRAQAEPKAAVLLTHQRGQPARIGHAAPVITPEGGLRIAQRAHSRAMIHASQIVMGAV